MNQRRTILLALFVCACSFSLSAQEPLDSVFFLKGNIDVVKILKNSSESIDCNYPNEDMITTISKSEIAKIRFRSGRVEICNESSKEGADEIHFANGEILQAKVIRLSDDSVDYLMPGEDLTRNTYTSLLKKIVFSSGRVETFSNTLNIKVITNESQWRDVVVTYNAADVRGLEQVGVISKASGWGGQLASGHGYNKSIELLQKEAAKMRCGLVYINDAPNRENTRYGAGTRVNATAYRIRETTDTEVNIEDLSELARSFADGSMDELSDSKILKAARDLASEIISDIDNNEIPVARKKYEILDKWLSQRIRIGRDPKLHSYIRIIQNRL